MNTSRNEAKSFNRSTGIRLVLVHHDAYKSTLLFLNSKFIALSYSINKRKNTIFDLY